MVHGGLLSTLSSDCWSFFLSFLVSIRTIYRMRESILFVIDSSLELHHETIPSSSSSRLDVIRQLILFYSACKLKTNASTVFSIGYTTKGGKVELLNARGQKGRAYTSNADELAIMLTESIAFQQRPCSDDVDLGGGKPFAMDSVLSALSTLQQSLSLSSNPHSSSKTRVILIWCHSAAEPSLTLPPPLPPDLPSSDRPLLEFTLDILFLHCKPNSQEAVDKLHSIFSSLTNQANSISSSSFLTLAPSSISPPKLFTVNPSNESKSRPSSYIYEASLHSPAAIRRVLGAFVQLMAPADIRLSQDDLPPSPSDLATLPLLQQRSEITQQPASLIPIIDIGALRISERSNSASASLSNEASAVSAAVAPPPPPGDLLGDLI